MFSRRSASHIIQNHVFPSLKSLKFSQKHQQQITYQQIRKFITVNQKLSQNISSNSIKKPLFISRSFSTSRLNIPQHTHISKSSLLTLHKPQFIQQSLPFNILKRNFFGSSKKNIPIPGARPPRTLFQKIRRFIFWLLFTGVFAAGCFVGLSLWIGQNLDKFMRFNILWTGKADIHYYATPERVNNKYSPLFTGDKVADTKLLQTKLIRDLYKIFLALSPMTQHMDEINKSLSQKRIQALRREAETNPDLAAELTDDVILELSYSTAINDSMLFTLRQQLVYFYFLVLIQTPTHSQSSETLHAKFEDLRDLEEEIEEIVLFVDTALDAVIEQTYTSSFNDHSKVKMYPPL